MTTPTELEYFEVTGFFYDVQQPLAGDVGSEPEFSVISGFVTFTPRLPATIYVDDLDVGGTAHDTALAVTPIVGQIMGGQLCSIDIPDTPGVQLLSNTANLGLAALGISELVYDVAFSSIVYAHKGFTLGNFAFVAPTDGTGVNITDPALTRLPPLSGALTSFTVESVFGPIRLVAGVPTDAAFLTAPKDGTLAFDTNNTLLYVRISGTWTPQQQTILDAGGTSMAIVTASETIGAHLNDTTIPTSAAVQAAINTATAVLSVALTPEHYGAVGNGSTNDVAALNACFADAAGKKVWLDPSKVYAHNDTVTIGQNGTIVTGGGTLKATNAAAQKSAVIVTGDGVVLDHVELTCPTASTRRSTLEDCKLALNQCDGAILRGVTIDGSSNFGLIVFGATNFYIDNPVIKNTMADGLHITYGSAHGVITTPSTDTTGDDGISVVSYGADSAVCTDIRISGFKVKDSSARGITVDGGTDIRYFDGDIDGTVAAPIYIGCETAFATYGVSDIIVANVDVANGNSAAPAIDHGAILVYNDRATGFDINTVVITDIRVRDTNASASQQINLQKQSTGKVTGIELGPMTFTGTGPSTILNTLNLMGPADLGFNGVADYVDNTRPRSTQVKAIDYVVGGTTEYRLLANLPSDNSGNVCSLSLTGRMGGWTSTDSAQWQILLSNRTAANDGLTVNSAVFGQGGIGNALGAVDIVVYAHVDKSASVYIKHLVGGFYAYDLDVRGVRSTIGYNGVKSTSVPTGTLIWSLSTAPKLTVDTAGVLVATGGGGNLTGMSVPAQVVASGAEAFTIVSGSITQIAGTTVNGITPAIGDRILVIGAPAATGTGNFATVTSNPANGVYVVTGNTTNLTVARALDFAGSNKPGGMSIFVEAGAWGSWAIYTVVVPANNSAFTYGSGNIQFKQTGGAKQIIDTLFINIASQGLGWWNGNNITFLEPPVNAGPQTITLPTGAARTLASLDGTEQFDNKTLVNPTIKNYTESVVPIGNTGTAKTIALTNGTVQTATLTGNCTFTMPALVAGKSFTLLLNTGAGSFTAAFTSVKWPANAAPVITTAAARLDLFTFTSDGVDWYGSIAQNYTP